MQIHHVRCARNDLAGDLLCDALGKRAVGLPGEHAIQVLAVGG
jgi:hypothetical protein